MRWLARHPSFSNMRASFLAKPKEAVSATMNRSIERVLTTHVGSLPRPSDLLDAIEAEQQDRPTDKDTRAARLRRAVKEVVCTQEEIGIDIIDDGEFGNPSFVSYVNERLGGCEIGRDNPPPHPSPHTPQPQC